MEGVDPFPVLLVGRYREREGEEEEEETRNAAYLGREFRNVMGGCKM